MASYRLQLSPGFRLTEARRLVPYLHALGISELYLSPLFQARPGSPHGYDLIDPTVVSAELGGEAELRALAAEARAYGMGLLLDIVPNHMAMDPANRWWRDVLEHGGASPYARYFDIDWERGGAAAKGQVTLPVLTQPYARVLEAGELRLRFNEHGFSLHCGALELPLDPRSCATFLEHGHDTLAERLGSEHPVVRGLAGLAAALAALPPRASGPGARPAERAAAAAAIQRNLWQLYRSEPEAQAFVDANLETFNGRPAEPTSFDLLERLLDQQAYRLAYWKTGMQQINYRRFFSLGDLIGVRVEDRAVLEASHALVVRLARDRVITGVRIDHVDGLYEPAAYLCRLRELLDTPPPGRRAAETTFVMVEKVLAPGEKLPADWPVRGTTGYDFLNTVNRLFVDPAGLAFLDSAYRQATGSAVFARVAYEKKKQVLESLFAPDVAALEARLLRLARQDRYGRDIPARQLVQALVEVTACLPVYRTYIRDFAVAPRDGQLIERAVAEARRRSPGLDEAALTFLRRGLALQLPAGAAEAQGQEWLGFVMRWQQLTGAVAAKGVEDTALYVYNRLLSLNEVGGDPGAGGISVQEFHRHNLERHAQWPGTMNATATHDTKRGEDVRARLNVLSELAEEWVQRLQRWRRWNRQQKPRLHGRPVPGANEEILLYQSLLGAWPLDAAGLPAFRQRLEQYLIKAAREAKVHTRWVRRDEDYEAAFAAFAGRILEPGPRNRFLPDFLELAERTAFYGAMNGLAQLLLKAAAPGVPDFYQGTELWDLSFVDPDNRRPVDFPSRIALLEQLERAEQGRGAAAAAREALQAWRDGRIKFFLTRRLLRFRREHQQLFATGAYVPIEARGEKRDHICAFARRAGSQWVLAIAPRLVTRLGQPGEPPLGEAAWRETALVLPPDAPGDWEDVLTDGRVSGRETPGGRAILVAEVLRELPVALLAPAT